MTRKSRWTGSNSRWTWLSLHLGHRAYSFRRRRMSHLRIWRYLSEILPSCAAEYITAYFPTYRAWSLSSSAYRPRAIASVSKDDRLWRTWERVGNLLSKPILILAFLTFDPSATRAQRGCIPTGQVYKEGRDPMLIITVERHDQGKKISELFGWMVLRITRYYKYRRGYQALQFARWTDYLHFFGTSLGMHYPTQRWKPSFSPWCFWINFSKSPVVLMNVRPHFLV